MSFESFDDANSTSERLRNRQALDHAIPDLYEDLHAIASKQMSKESPATLLQTTAIVHEAYVRLAAQRTRVWEDRPSFFAAAAVVMRRVLIDMARKEKAIKRGGQANRNVLSETRLTVSDPGFTALEVNDALEELAAFAPDQARALELSIFGGMKGDEIAEVMSVSASTVDRKLRTARAWLRRELS